MTLQLVDISQLGIVCAADSAITPYETRKGQESWSKLVRIDRLKAIIGYYGHALVGNKRMPDWLEAFIRQSGASDLDAFAFELRDRLNKGWKPPPKMTGTGFHLSGYSLVKKGVIVPSFHHVWNHKGVEGNYRATGSGFQATSDFLERDAVDYVPNNLDKYFGSIGGSRVYRNGVLVPYYALASAMNEFRKKLWTEGLISPLQNIEEWAWYYRFELETVKLMYRYVFNVKRPPIGREIDIYTIDTQGRIKKLPHKRNGT